VFSVLLVQPYECGVLLFLRAQLHLCPYEVALIECMPFYYYYYYYYFNCNNFGHYPLCCLSINTTFRKLDCFRLSLACLRRQTSFFCRANLSRFYLNKETKCSIWIDVVRVDKRESSRGILVDRLLRRQLLWRNIPGRSDGKVLGIQSERKWIVSKKLSKDNRCWNKKHEGPLKAHLWGFISLLPNGEHRIFVSLFCLKLCF
jgi:hypothetical protein